MIAVRKALNVALSYHSVEKARQPRTALEQLINILAHGKDESKEAQAPAIVVRKPANKPANAAGKRQQEANEAPGFEEPRKAKGKGRGKGRGKGQRVRKKEPTPEQRAQEVVLSASAFAEVFHHPSLRGRESLPMFDRRECLTGY